MFNLLWYLNFQAINLISLPPHPVVYSFCIDRIDQDLKSTVYCTGISDGGEEEWDFLYQQYKSSNVAAETWLRYSYIQHLASIWLLVHKLSSNRKLFVSYQPAKQKNFLLLHTNLLSRKTSFVHARAVSTLLFSAATFDDLYCWYKKSHSSSPPSDIPVQYTVLHSSCKSNYQCNQ
jgi:hypothetical protein